MNKKVLYLMHVQWGWIKQRPHFIAEYLSRQYDVTVVTQKEYTKKNIVTNPLKKCLSFVDIFRLPFERFKIIAWLNDLYFSYKIFKMASQCEYLWITDPRILKRIRFLNLDSYTLIYDCMDDTVEFPSVKANHQLVNEILGAEKKLCNCAHLVFCSSATLKKRLVASHQCDKNKITIINNALDDTQTWSIPVRSAPVPPLKLGYVGTIDRWFDFNLILEALEHFKNKVEVVLYGPSAVVIPSHPNLRYGGILPHHDLPEFLSSMDALVMPFILNPLIEAVDPVKAYEYVASGKRVILPNYTETRKFADYADLYTDANEFFMIIDQCLHDTCQKNSAWSIDQFIENNNWNARASKIIGCLQNRPAEAISEVLPLSDRNHE